jgi:very-short-patch-repair endonuclease
MDLATRQHGVVSTKQLEALGYTDRSTTKSAAAGRLHRVHQRVYAVGHRRLTWHGRCWAAVLAAEPHETEVRGWPVVASHASAAYLWGLLRYQPETIHVTAPTRRRGKREFWVHFSSILAPEDRAEREGIPVTSLARTFLDLAASWQAERLERSLERAEETGLFDLHEVEALLRRAGGHRGRGRLDRAAAIYRPDPTVTRSGFERRFREGVARVGLPVPSMNYLFAQYELDACWPDLRFAVELDLFETHGTRAAFERDRRRQEELKLLGMETIRITEPRFRAEPDLVLANLATLLDRRRLEVGPAGGGPAP